MGADGWWDEPVDGQFNAVTCSGALRERALKTDKEVTNHKTFWH
jgi:hypothetical protein